MTLTIHEGTAPIDLGPYSGKTINKFDHYQTGGTIKSWDFTLDFGERNPLIDPITPSVFKKLRDKAQRYRGSYPIIRETRRIDAGSNEWIAIVTAGPIDDYVALPWDETPPSPPPTPPTPQPPMPEPPPVVDRQPLVFEPMDETDEAIELDDVLKEIQ